MGFHKKGGNVLECFDGMLRITSTVLLIKSIEFFVNHKKFEKRGTFINRLEQYYMNESFFKRLLLFIRNR
jgi:hypothetical protein